MSKRISFQTDRLLEVLAVRRLSQVTLAAMVGVSPSTISKWRSGAQAPEPDKLDRLASVVNVAPEWFTRPTLDPTSAPLFRSNASAHQAAREMLGARMAWVQDIAASLQDYVDFPALSFPVPSFTDPDQITSADIEAVAQECREMWGLGTGPVQDVVLALENAGAIVIREETGVGQIEGLSAWSSVLGRPLVHLASDKSNGFRSRFDAAHELGHLVLHRSIPKATDRLRYNEMERQAHRFAGAFLLPAESFAAEVRLPVTLDSLLLHKQRWGVSVGAIVMRLEALKLISEGDKVALFKRRSARWGVKSEPGDAGWAPEQPRLLRRTIELLLAEGVMTTEGVARHFGLSEQDVEMLTGLPENYLKGPAEVLQMPVRRIAPASIEPPSSSGVVVAFDPRRRRGGD
ncbi:XRE family transcriptional regulator [Luteibacter sp. SG786]|uniref:XRE family transcriptional regulator n=1 Tax=Luteibacter sp. SG786 TaxID=2587130 RepID=UPI0014211D82|nr:XRE family transcriptional regulator [Luteibacter sp. SG786]NII56110.1 Zn-dependent peptidase ImmA (M78 family)/transcriptional regulator with XRE-family HTH domain [Luteibacter sp. SG786]